MSALLAVFTVVVFIILSIWLRRVCRNIKKARLFKKEQYLYENSLSNWAIQIGYHFERKTPPLKIAGTDERSKAKLFEMIENLNNSKHEYQLYKDIYEPINVNVTPLVGPTSYADQTITVHDFRAGKCPKLICNEPRIPHASKTKIEQLYSMDMSLEMRRRNTAQSTCGNHSEMDQNKHSEEHDEENVISIHNISVTDMSVNDDDLHQQNYTMHIFERGVTRNNFTNE